VLAVGASGSNASAWSLANLLYKVTNLTPPFMKPAIERERGNRYDVCHCSALVPPGVRSLPFLSRTMEALHPGHPALNVMTIMIPCTLRFK
jgi:hypothetical protein